MLIFLAPGIRPFTAVGLFANLFLLAPARLATQYALPYFGDSVVGNMHCFLVFQVNIQRSQPTRCSLLGTLCTLRLCIFLRLHPTLMLHLPTQRCFQFIRLY